MADWNTDWIEIPNGGLSFDAAIKLQDRALEMMRRNPRLLFPEALRRARQEMHQTIMANEFKEDRMNANSMTVMFDEESVKLRDRAREIHGKNPTIRFGEALRQAREQRAGYPSDPRTPTDPNSIQLRDRAMVLMEESNPKLSFGQVLRQARQELLS